MVAAERFTVLARTRLGTALGTSVVRSRRDASPIAAASSRTTSTAAGRSETGAVALSIVRIARKLASPARTTYVSMGGTPGRPLARSHRLHRHRYRRPRPRHHARRLRGLLDQRHRLYGSLCTSGAYALESSNTFDPSPRSFSIGIPLRTDDDPTSGHPQWPCGCGLLAHSAPAVRVNSRKGVTHVPGLKRHPCSRLQGELRLPVPGITRPCARCWKAATILAPANRFHQTPPFIRPPFWAPALAMRLQCSRP